MGDRGARTPRCRGRIGTLMLLLLCVTVASPPAAAESTNRSVRHLTDRTVVEAGAMRVIAFRVDAVLEEDRTLPCAVADPSRLAVTLDPAVGAGREIGFVRVAGLETGRTTLAIAGATLVVDVVPPRVAEHEAQLAPRLVGPSEGAVVWGPISVGVDIELRPGDPLRPVVVRGPGGLEIEAIEDTGPAHPPRRQLRFEFDADELPPGPCTLTPVAIRDDGTERPGVPVQVRVARPEFGNVIYGEAEQRYDVARPQRFRDDRMNVGRDRRASGGMYFSNISAQPAVCFPVEVDDPGWYQFVMVARGTRAQGVLPTVGIVIGEGAQSGTNGRLLGEQWHRLAVGVPFELGAGVNVLTPFFANDFFIPGRADRNLYLDSFEVARVADASGPVVEHDDNALGAMMGGGDTMMGGAAMMMGDAGADVADDAIVRDVRDPFGETAAPLRVAFVRPLEGLILPGLLEVEGRCWWTNPEAARAPVVTLLVNDEPALEQRSGAPRFWVDPSFFEPGANRVQLVARTEHAIARTPVQTVHWPAEAIGEPRPARRVHRRFSIHEGAWDREILLHLRSEHHPAERRAVVMASNGELGLELPDEMEGSYEVMMELRGDHFNGPPIATVTIEELFDDRHVGTIKAPGWWDTRRAGRVELKAGPKRLVIGFRNDRHVKGVGDRNLWFQSVILVERPAEPERVAPVTRIVYPPAGHRAWMADALVAEASDNASLASAELLIDGAPTGIVADLNLKAGRVVLPLLLRSLEPGPHTAALRAKDVSGNTMDGEPLEFVVADAPPEEPTRYERAVHLLNRFACGPDVEELAAILTMGETEWLADRLGRPADDPGDLAALGTAFTYFAGRSEYEVPQRALAHLLLTPNPARARFVLWADNHFSTWIRKTGGPRKWSEHVSFARLGAAPFGHLLFASAQSPAMLAYLDQDRSVVERMNENYAREIMELHTLGVDGGYSQEDVTELARLLTGWSAVMEGDGRGGGPNAQSWSFRFDPNLNEDAVMTVLGMDFAPSPGRDGFDRIHLAMELLVAHPSTARFIARKLAEHYVGVPAPIVLVEDLAETYLSTGGDLRAMLVSMSQHESFWAPEHRDRVAHPIDYAVRLARTTHHFQPWQISEFLKRSGRGLFDRPTPDGYPEEDSTVTDSNALAQRWRLAHEFRWPLVKQVPGTWRHRDPVSEAAWSQQVVDLLAVRLTGRVLTDRSNEAAVNLLRESGGQRDERVQMIAPFIAQLPEANLR